MKRTCTMTLALIMALALGPASVHAQWGIKGGMARSNVKVFTGATAGDGISAGLVSNMGEGPVSFMSEALFVQKISEISGTTPGGTPATATVTNNNLDVTGLLRVNLGTAAIRPIIFGGGYYSYLISTNEKVVDSQGTVLSEDTAIADGTQTDYGWVAGAGVVVGQFTIDARYMVGLKHAVVTPAGFDDFQTISVMLGVTF